MSEALGALAQYLGETCADCGTAGPQRHRSAVAGCGTCAAGDPRPVAVPVRTLLGIPDSAVLTYDMLLPTWPDDAVTWTPLRDVFPRWHSGKACYSLPSGNMVHVTPACRCSRSAARTLKRTR